MRLFCLLLVFSSVISADESVCYGSTSNGRLEGGVKLPHAGTNFVSYSKTAEILGRTYVHSTVKKIVLEAYKNLETEWPQKVFILRTMTVVDFMAH